MFKDVAERLYPIIEVNKVLYYFLSIVQPILISILNYYLSIGLHHLEGNPKTSQS